MSTSSAILTVFAIFVNKLCDKNYLSFFVNKFWKITVIYNYIKFIVILISFIITVYFNCYENGYQTCLNYINQYNKPFKYNIFIITGYNDKK